ncbi:MAG: hypothetical protein QOH43_898 [Solirubrobacteraceae bacterium]|nr:hypothetical protein [Solirubrobacteraceae bacterium]
MFAWIVRGSLRFRLLVLPAAAALLIFGIVRLGTAPVDVLPEYTKPYVEVQTESLGLSAAEVEQLITVPLEQVLLNGVQGVDQIRSDSVPGLSSVVLVFERGTNILRARQLVQERLTQAHALPNVSQPPQMIQPVSSTSRVMMIGLSSRRLSPIDLSVLARWTIRPRLVGLSGVANVAIWGQRERQLQVQVDPERLRRHDVSLFQVIKTTGNAQLVSPLTFLDASTPGTGGFIDGPNQRLGVRHVLPFGAPADLGRVPIDRRHGPPLRLGEVATVVEDHQPLIGDAVVDGGPGLMLVVEKLPGANTLAVTREVERALDDLRPGLAGVTVDSSVFRPATYIEDAIDHLALAALIAGALALLALVAFLFAWRAVLVCLVAVPLSVVTALLVLDLTGSTLNAVGLAGIVVALGILVDDAVGDVHAVTRSLEQERRAGRDPVVADLVAETSLRERGVLGPATLIVLLAMAPVLLAGGLTGAFVHPLALAYVLAVLASMAVALTVVPALCVVLFSGAPRAPDASPPVRGLRRAYGAGLASFIRTRRPVLVAVGGLALIGLAILPLTGTALRPSFKDRDLLVKWSATPSTSLPEMERITARASAELRSLPGVGGVGAHVGRAVTSDQPVGTGSGEMWVSIRPAADYDATLRSIRRVVAGYPGLRGRVLTYEDDRSAGVLTHADDGLDVRIYGQDLGILERKAQELRRVLGGIDGVRAPRAVLPAVQPTLQVQVDLERARRHGIKPGDVRRAAAALVAGIEVGSFFERQKVFQVVVRGVATTHHSIDSIRRLLIDTPTGGHVRVGDVARVAITPNPVDIRHEAVSRYVDVRAAVAGRSADDVRAEAGRRIRAMAFPYEYHAEVLAAADDVRAPAGRFASFAIAAAIGIFLLLQAAFRSWRLAALLAAVLPLALVDGLLVAFVHGEALSLGEAVGLLAVFAIAVRNAIVLISRLQRLEDDGTPRGPGLVLRVAGERLVPVLATATVTALIMAPLALMGDVAGNEITHPMALVILGGLVTSTVLTLWILPALYLHLQHGSRERAAQPATAEPPRVPVPPVGTTA